VKIIATGLTGTIGRKIDRSITPAKLVLGSEKLTDFFNPNDEPLKLIHLGGIVGESKVSEDLDYSKHINVDETLRLAREVIEGFGGKFVHISSSHVYGPHESPITEEFSYNPRSNYAKQKMQAEVELLNYFGESHKQLTILRVFSVLGWDVADFTLGGAVKRIHSGSVESISNTDDVRDFMTPTSIANAISNISRLGNLSGVYNLCTGVGISVGDAARDMFNVKNYEKGHSQLLPGNSTSPHLVGDNTKLKNAGLNLELKWDPEGDL
jgi:nucleoside-diphosphate-sugar epimerase